MIMVMVMMAVWWLCPSLEGLRSWKRLVSQGHWRRWSCSPVHRRMSIPENEMSVPLCAGREGRDRPSSRASFCSARPLSDICFFCLLSSQRGDAPLHLAALSGDTNVVKYLVEQNADMDVQNEVRLRCLPPLPKLLYFIVPIV